MEVAVPCIICKANTPCGCKESLVIYFSILQKVHQRVLREKAASRVDHLPVVGAGIDKLNLYFKEPIKADVVLTRAKQFNYEIGPAYLNDKAPALKIGNGESAIHFKYDFSRSHFVQIISNPNSFKTWEAYYDFLLNIIPSETICTAHIFRLDLNLDFSCSLQTLIQSIDIKNKRKSIAFLDESGKRTGANIGKGYEKIVIYDKAIKDNLPSPLTRIELRLQGNKLPTRSILELRSSIQNSEFFQETEGLNLQYLKHNDQNLRLVEFKSNFKREGFYSAKKIANQHRNFDRDFASLIEIKKWDLQLPHLFKNAIQGFLHPIKRGSPSKLCEIH